MLLFNAHNKPISIPGYELLYELLRILSFSGVMFSDLISAGYYNRDIFAKNSILKTESIYTHIFDYFDASLYYRTKDSSLILVFLGSLVLIYLLLILAYFRFDIITDKGRRKGVERLFLLLFSILLNNYNLVFLLLNIQFLRIPFCRRSSEFEAFRIRKDGYLADDENQAYYDSLGNIFDSKSQNTMSIESLTYSYISESMSCYSSVHILAIVLGTILQILNCLFWNISVNFKSMAPSLKIKGVFYRKSMIYFNEIVMNVFFISKPIVELFISSEDYYQVDIIFYLYIFFMTMLFTMNSIYYTMYVNSDQIILNLRSLYFMTTSLVIIAVREKLTSLLSDEFSTLVIILVLFSVGSKLTANLIENHKKRILLGVKSRSKLSKTELLIIHFEVMRFIDSYIRFGESNSLEFKIIAEQLLKIHYESCTKPDCICKDREIFLEDHPLEQLEELLPGTRIVDIMIIIAESLLKFNIKREFTSEEILNCSVYFHICFLGDLKCPIFELNRYLSDCKNKGFAASTSSLCFLTYLREYIAINTKEGVIRLRQYKSLKIEEVNEDLGPVLDMTNFLSITMRVKAIKVNILECNRIMIEYTQNIQSEGTLEKGYCLSKAFMHQKQKVFVDFNQMNKLTKSSYKPLLVLHAHFLAHVHQDIKSAAKTLLSAFSRGTTSNLNRFWGGLKFPEKMNEAVIIIIEQDSSFNNSIKYCSSNCCEFVGWSSEELIGRQIETLIAQPYARWHSTIMESGNGKFTALQSPRDVLCLGKDGFIKKVEILVRHNLNSENFLQYGGCLQFSLSEDKPSMIITDNDGEIQGMTEAASRDFMTYKNIANLNNHFKSIIKKCLKVSQEIYNAKGTRIKEYMDRLGDQQKRIEEWRTYQTWKLGAKIKLLSYKCELITLVCRISCLRIPYIKGKFIFRFEFIGKEIFNSFKNKHTPFSKGSDDVSVPSVEFEANQASLAEPKRLNFKKKSIAEILNPLVKSSGFQDILSLSNESPPNEKSGECKVEKNSNAPLKNSAENLFVLKLIKNKRFQSTGATMEPKDIDLAFIEMILHTKIKMSKLDRGSWILSVILFLLLVCNLVLIYLRSYFTIGTLSEVIKVAPVIDNFNWGIWAQIGFPFYMDLCRLTYEGVFPVDYGAEIGYETMWDKCSTTMQWIENYLILSDLKIDETISKISYPQIAKVDDWIHFRSNYTSKDEVEKDWRTKRIPRLSSIKPLQIEMTKIMNRNYSSGDLNFIRTKNGYIDRELDQAEELVRKNLIGDFNRQYALRSYEIYQYITNLFNLNITFLLWTNFAIWTVSAILYTSFYLYKYCEVKSMEEFYNKLYYLEIKDVYNSILELENKREFLFQVLLKEEPITYENHINKAKKGFSNQSIAVSSTEKVNQRAINKSIIKSTNSKVGKQKNWIRVKFNRFDFGGSWLLCMMLILVLMLGVFQVCSSILIYPKISRGRNISSTYILNTEVWNSLFTLHCVFFNTIFWNNTVDYWGTDSLSTFTKLSNYIKEEVVANISSTLDFDLGNYTESYRDVMTKVKLL